MRELIMWFHRVWKQKQRDRCFLTCSSHLISARRAFWWNRKLFAAHLKWPQLESVLCLHLPKAEIPFCSMEEVNCHLSNWQRQEGITLHCIPLVRRLWPLLAEAGLMLHIQLLDLLPGAIQNWRKVNISVFYAQCGWRSQSLFNRRCLKRHFITP